MLYPDVAIIDYQMSNLFSVKHACDALGMNCEITSDNDKIWHAKAVILPGVGAFGDAMKNLQRLKLTETITNFIKSGRKFMGVCLGMQLLFSESEEFGFHRGLNICKGRVIKFENRKPQMRVPQIGWNKIYSRGKISTNWRKSPLDGLNENDYFYFVHSYYVQPIDNHIVLSFTKYEGIEYCSSLLSNNVFAVQFHPEKSGEKGLLIYKNFFGNKL